MSSTKPKPGDLCRFLSAEHAEHVAPCGLAGKITEIRTGRVLTDHEAARLQAEVAR